MKNLAKILALTLAAVLMISVFAACGSDESDEKSSSLEGTWVMPDEKYGDLTITIDGKGGYTFEQSKAKGSGKYELDEENCTVKVNLPANVEIFTYKLDGDSLVLTNNRHTYNFTRK